MKLKIILPTILLIVWLAVAGCSSSCSSKTPNSTAQNSTETTTTASKETTPSLEASDGAKAAAATGEKEKPSQNAQKEDSSNTKSNSNTTVQPKKKTKLVSASQLTDEKTGKGEISMGDTLKQVKAVLAKYQFANSKITYYPPSNGGPSQYWIGTTAYLFDEKGKLAGIMSATGAGFAFETSRGLKLGDTVAKMKSIYGTKYKYTDGSADHTLSNYVYTFNGRDVMFQIEPNAKGDKALIWEIDF
ncbi:MAG: hypothetical protein FWD65_01620 [Coriobacteriia bacterium]|nr:hypothetical protein [Coriobacteriia bacterium]